MKYESHELPMIPRIPSGFKVSETESSYDIEHTRTGMGCLNMFLAGWMFLWTLFYLTITLPFEGFSPDTFGGFFVPVIIVALLLVCSVFQKKSFRLGEDSLCIETRLWFVKWHLTLPRKTVIHLLQVKDGGEGRDSFPSWGLKIKSASDDRSLVEYVVSHIYSGSNIRYRSVLFRLPYQHSYWLGIVIARWANARLDLCRRISY
ncbi:MAG: hypothetical protein WBB01_10100 [Phormidesmis sp.]